MTKAEKALLAAASRPEPPEAYANVNGAVWTTNYFNWTRKTDSWNIDNEEWTGNWTTKNENARQGNYKRTDAVGTNEDGTAMSTRKAEALLDHAKYTTKSAHIELFDSDGWWLEDVWVTAREDAFGEQKKLKLEYLKVCHGDDIYWGHEFDIITQTWNVGDYKMESIFPPTQWPDLAHDTSDEAGGDEYKGRLYWSYQEINETGDTAGYTHNYQDMWASPVIYEQRFFDFLSYTYDPESDTICDDNQVMVDAPHISDGVTRTFAVKPIERQVRVPKMLNKGISIWTGHYTTNTVRVGTKVEVVQYEKIYEGQ